MSKINIEVQNIGKKRQSKWYKLQ